MNISFSFRVTGIPKGQPRHRAFARKMGAKYVARVYHDDSADGWKSCIGIAASPYIPSAPMEGPIRFDIDFLFPRPARLMRRKDPAERIPHTAKPDRDNCDKAAMDALTKLGFWLDDAQVCQGEPRKFYVAKGENPGAEIRITSLSPATQEATRCAMSEDNWPIDAERAYSDNPGEAFDNRRTLARSIVKRMGWGEFADIAVKAAVESSHMNTGEAVVRAVVDSIRARLAAAEEKGRSLAIIEACAHLHRWGDINLADALLKAMDKGSAITARAEGGKP